MKYNKPVTSFQEQCGILKQRGLVIDNETSAIEALQNISYYRLSAYFLPFQDIHDQFKPGVKFQDILGLYEFDRHLRDMFWDALESVEISMRTQMTYHLARQYGAFGYIEAKNFSPSFKHAEWLERLEENIARSHEIFIKHYRIKYSENSHFPLWMVTEIVSFGQLSQLFHGLVKKDKQVIAHAKYNVDQVILTSWLHTLVYIRNLCAHHSRLWNRTLAIAPKVPRKSTEWDGANSRKIFSALLIVKHMMIMTDEWNEWKEGFVKLVNEHPSVNVHAMGFSANWKTIFA